MPLLSIFTCLWEAQSDTFPSCTWCLATCSPASLMPSAGDTLDITWPCSLLCRGRNGGFHTIKEGFSTIQQTQIQLTDAQEMTVTTVTQWPFSRGSSAKRDASQERMQMWGGRDVQMGHFFSQIWWLQGYKPSREHRGNTERNRLATYCHRLHVWFHAFSIHLRTVYQPGYQFQYISVL